MNAYRKESYHPSFTARPEHAASVLTLLDISLNNKCSLCSRFFNALDLYAPSQHDLKDDARRLPLQADAPALTTSVTRRPATGDGNLRYQSDPSR